MKPSDATQQLVIRPATATDRPSIIRLIDEIYHEYSDRVCLEGAEADLVAVPDYYRSRGGDFWVLVDEHNQTVYGTHAAFRSEDSASIGLFRRLYLASQLRGSGWGTELMQLTIDWAWEHDCRQIEFWSDTRFERAHAFFGKFGFRRTGEMRTCHDGHTPYSEYHFVLRPDWYEASTVHRSRLGSRRMGG